jgi:hypothetical protein
MQASDESCRENADACFRHCEEQGDEAIHSFLVRQWIASLTLAMTVNVELLQSFRNTIEAIQPVISAMNAVTSP